MGKRGRKPTFSDVAEMMKEMREVGHFTDRMIVKKSPGIVFDKKQFIIVCMATAREIRACDNTALRDFRASVKRLRKLKCHEGYLQFGRVTVLMNELQHHHNKHGEARLLDPDGGIRYELDICDPSDEYQEDFDYLDAMEETFVEDFGEDAHQYLLIFSHYIPCTIDGHKCADVIGEFARHSSYKMYVGYENVYKGTDKDEAVQAMKDAGVGIIFPTQL